MCNQTVSLMAAELERRGVTTVIINLLRVVAEKDAAPHERCLCPFLMAILLIPRGTRSASTPVIDAALRLVEDTTLEPPALVDYPPSPKAPV